VQRYNSQGGEERGQSRSLLPTRKKEDKSRRLRVRGNSTGAGQLCATNMGTISSAVVIHPKWEGVSSGNQVLESWQRGYENFYMGHGTIQVGINLGEKGIQKRSEIPAGTHRKKMNSPSTGCSLSYAWATGKGGRSKSVPTSSYFS